MERIVANQRFLHNEGDHVARYVWVRDQLIGKQKTLDCGCGVGYGTSWLRKNDVDIIGIDCSRNAILDYNRNNMFVADSLHLPFSSNSFDAVISFEVIEHLDDVNSFLCNVCDVLRPEGLFIGSTPIRKPRKYKNGKPINPYHKKEYYVSELLTILNEYFEIINLYGQCFPSRLGKVLLTQLHKFSILRNQTYFFPIHNEVTLKDEKCIWIASKPK